MGKIMKKFLLSLVFIFLFSIQGLASVYIVDAKYIAPKGKNAGTSACESGNFTFTNVSAAIDAATIDWSGIPHTIRICPGTYTENNIALDSTALDNGIIESTTGNKADVLITSNANNGPIFSITASISNLTMRNFSIKTTKDKGISQTTGTFQNSTFQNLSINSQNESLFFTSIGNMTFKDLTLSSINTGCFNAGNAGGPLIITTQNQPYNLLTCKDTGINLGSSVQNYTIEHTKITTSNANAASITATAANTLTVNDIECNASKKGSGIWIDGTVNTLDINNSKFYNMLYEAIYIKTLSSSGSKITNNIIDGGNRGIFLPNFLNPITIQKNIIQNATDYGLYLLNAPVWRSSQIDHNCFIDNKVSAYSRDTNAKFDDGAQGNYWSDWSGSGNYTIQDIPKYDTHPLSQCPLIAFPTPIADYHMDECAWNGTSSEVKDSSGNNLNGAAQATAQTTAGGILNNTGFFNNGTGNTDAIIIPDSDILSPHTGTNGEITVSAWVKLNAYPSTALQNRIPIVAKGDNNNWEYALYVYSDHRAGFSVWQSNGSSYKEISGGTLNLNTWYHITGVLKKGSFARVYVNGNLVVEATSKFNGTTTNGTSPLYIARRGSGNNYLNGYVDEVKIFDKSLSVSEIGTIYDNEKVGKNYDGTARASLHCRPSLTSCWNENFNNPSLVGKWDVSGKNYTPTVLGGRLRLTEANQNIATLATLNGELPADANYIEIEFDQFAYGGNGADGMTLTLSDASITPKAGANGGSLGYAQKNGVNGFAGGWLGFGIDEFGNYSAATEGRVGGESASDQTPTDREIDSFAIRGSGNKAVGYAYLTGTTTLNPEIDKNSNGHKYRLSIDTRANETWLKVDRQTSSNSPFVEIIPWYNATQSATAPQNFRLSLTSSTGGATNIHEADNFLLQAFSCGTIGNQKPQTNFAFDARDSFRSLSDRNISTKIVGKSFDLNVTSLNETNNGLQDFNGTVCVQIVDENNVSLSGNWVETKTVFNPATNSSLVSFTINKASKKATPMIAWKKDGTLNCSASPLTGDDNRTLASDFFAVRPDKFTINSSKATAGIPFDINFTAPMNASLSASTNYNESAGVSFDVSLKEHNASCITGTWSPNPNSFSFVNGFKKFTTTYSEVGLLDLNISDSAKPCASRFTAVDCDDANVSDGSTYSANLLPIGETVAQITVVPHHFKVTSTFLDFKNGAFTYLSNDTNLSKMSAELNATITAQNANNATTTNYNTDCYANATNATINYQPLTIDPSANLINLHYLETNSPISGTVGIGAGTFTLLNLPKTIFSTNDKGSAKLNVLINFDRSDAKPVNPFDLNISKIQVADASYPTVKGEHTPDSNATFVYGRIHAYDIQTNQASTPDPVEIEVYGKNASNTFLNGKPQNVLYWYRNTDHDFASQGSVTIPSPGTTHLTFTTSTPPENGLHVINIDYDDPTNATKQTVKMELPSWLLVSPANNEFTYEYVPTTNTIDTLKDNSKGVNSGTFSGSDFEIQKSKQTTKKGIKLFR